jgi:gamma-glutamyltranspeptidase / glutathione hydrolase
MDILNTTRGFAVLTSATPEDHASMTVFKGIVAAGHEVTATAAVDILREGGNAFDAAIAAVFAACVAEPVLCSLGGGGFMLTHPSGRVPELHDFFAHTPRHRPPVSEMDFYPVVVDFGTAQQEFHIGMGAMATPGVVRGLFEVHRRLGRLPMLAVVQPACRAAREGVVVNALQRYISELISPIIASGPQALALHRPRDGGADAAGIALEGARVVMPELADTFEALARDGDRLFYEGEIGARLVRDAAEQGGCLRREDLTRYKAVVRIPLQLDYHDARLFTNPAPSVGGTLIAFTLSLLQPERTADSSPAGPLHLSRVARAQMLTQRLRRERRVDLALDEAMTRQILAPGYVQEYLDIMGSHPAFSRGTTHISVADGDGNLAATTVSNGEGCGYVIPGTGILMNNMLGEEDINPHGFHRWPVDTRIASMMAPTLAFTGDGQAIVTGSGGSNRIRSAILQVLLNLVDYGLDAAGAVEHPRIHFEGHVLNVEAGLPERTIDALKETFPDVRIWPTTNLFFGGAHTVVRLSDGQFVGRGDSRRGGVCLMA